MERLLEEDFIEIVFFRRVRIYTDGGIRCCESGVLYCMLRLMLPIVFFL